DARDPRGEVVRAPRPAGRAIRRTDGRAAAYQRRRDRLALVVLGQLPHELEDHHRELLGALFEFGGFHGGDLSVLRILPRRTRREEEDTEKRRERFRRAEIYRRGRRGR